MFEHSEMHTKTTLLQSRCAPTDTYVGMETR